MSFFRTVETALGKRTSRERVFIYFTAGVILFIAFDSLVYSPLSNRLNKQSEVLEQITQTLTAFDQQQLLFKEEIRKKKEGVELEIIDLKKNLQSNASAGLHYLKAHDLLSVLEVVIGKAEGLRVEVLNNQTPIAVEEGLDLYVHPVELRLNGAFKDVVDFVGRIESIPVPLFIQHLEYQVLEHPNAQVDITIHFIIQDKAFIKF